MRPFTYSRVQSAEAALLAAGQDGAMYLGGGTNLVDLMREGVAVPAALVDVTGLRAGVAETAGGGLIRSEERRVGKEGRSRG